MQEHPFYAQFTSIISLLWLNSKQLILLLLKGETHIDRENFARCPPIYCTINTFSHTYTLMRIPFLYSSTYTIIHSCVYFYFYFYFLYIAISFARVTEAKENKGGCKIASYTYIWGSSCSGKAIVEPRRVYRKGV